MSEIKSMRICDCCGHPIIISGSNLDTCDNCGTEYWNDDTGTYVNILNLMDSIERVEDEF